MFGTRYIIYDTRPSKSGMYRYYQKTMLTPVVETGYIVVKQWRYHFSWNQLLTLKQQLIAKRIDISHLAYEPVQELRIQVSQRLRKIQAQFPPKKSQSM